ncbi:MAG: polysaccharide biosynthesis/export family protein [Bryobacterales bacterium]|nr:polysaccharide biosynthesis/export family protein [Bryobacterales bacterium]
MTMRAGLLLTALCLLPLAAQDQTTTYILGPEDTISVAVQDLEELKDLKPVRIDLRGFINIPVAGRVKASGLTVEQLEASLRKQFLSVLQEPEVTVTVTEFRSQPVSILGAVRTPGVHQVHGRKTLYEILSLAGGLNPDAGNSIRISRKKAAGVLPLSRVVLDPSGDYQVADLSVKDVMTARNPQDNIEILPYDVISVPKGELVYVIGAVKKSGGFLLSEREKVSVLQALTMAEGLDRLAATKNAKILRQTEASEQRKEIGVNLKEILEGRAQDVAMLPNDILFVPNSAAKSAGMRTLEAAIQIGTGVAIFRR